MRIGLVRKQDIEQLGLWDKHSRTLLAFLLTFRSIRTQIYTICRMKTLIECAHFTPFHVYRQCLIILPFQFKQQENILSHWLFVLQHTSFLKSYLLCVPQVKCIYKIISLHRYFILCQALQYFLYFKSNNAFHLIWVFYFYSWCNSMISNCFHSLFDIFILYLWKMCMHIFHCL